MINKELQEYIEKEIIPMYDNHDDAHKRDHAYAVIEKACKLAELKDADMNICYAAAACHDIGLKYGREEHNIWSGSMVRADFKLHRFFTPTEIETIAEACEDHRASLGREPRGLIAKIISDADRDGSIEVLITRSYNYYKSHNPDSTHEERLKHAFDHLNEKCGKNGYVKYWLPETKEMNSGVYEYLEDEKKFREVAESLNLDK